LIWKVSFFIFFEILKALETESFVLKDKDQNIFRFISLRYSTLVNLNKELKNGYANIEIIY